MSDTKIKVNLDKLREKQVRLRKIVSKLQDIKKELEELDIWYNSDFYLTSLINYLVYMADNIHLEWKSAVVNKEECDICNNENSSPELFKKNK